MNFGADLLSIGDSLATDWRFHPQVVQMIWNRFRTAQVDLFASKENTHCPLSFLVTNDNLPLGSGTLAHPFPHTLLCAFPPFAHIQTVLERVAHRRTHHDLGSSPLAYVDIVLRPGLPRTGRALGTAPLWGLTSTGREKDSECQSPVH